MTAGTLPYEIAAPADTPRARWLEIHNTGIGSSDAASAVGLSPWESPYSLYLTKTGELDEREQTEAMSLGTKLEEFVAVEYFERHWDKHRHYDPYVPGCTLRSIGHPFMMATPDRYFEDDEGVGVLEVKTTGLWARGDWDEFPPDHVQLQCLHQLAVTGLERAEVVVLIGGQELRSSLTHPGLSIRRDDALIANLIEGESRFWQHVVDRTPPPVDGSDSTIEALRKQFDAPDPASIAELPAQLVRDLLIERQAAEEKIARGEWELNAVKAHLMEQLGDREIGMAEGRTVCTWKAGERRSVDLKALKAQMPEVAAQFERVTATRTFRFTTTCEEKS